MTYEQFVEAARYAVSKLDQEQIDYGWYIMGKNHLYDLPSEIESALIDGMDDWCNDNNIEPEEWREEWDVIDVWCDGQSNPDETVNESYSEDKFGYGDSTVTNGMMIDSLRGYLNLILDYDKYCKNALTDLVDYYKKLGIKVISSIALCETAEGGDGFVIRLDRQSVEEFLTKNGHNYDDYKGEEEKYVSSYKADDLEMLTLKGWFNCKNVKMMFDTLWRYSEHQYVGMETWLKPEGDLKFIFDEEAENSVTISYHPETFETVDDILSKVSEVCQERNLLNCMKYA